MAQAILAQGNHSGSTPLEGQGRLPRLGTAPPCHGVPAPVLQPDHSGFLSACVLPPTGPPQSRRHDIQPAQHMAGRLSPIREQEECDEASMPNVQMGVQGAMQVLRLVLGKGRLPQAPIRRCSTKQASAFERAPQGSSSQRRWLQQQLIPAPGGKRAGITNGAGIQEDSVL